MKNKVSSSVPDLNTQHVLRNSGHALGEVSDLLSILEVRLEQHAATCGMSEGTLLCQDFDLLCQTIDEMRLMFTRLSHSPGIDAPVSFADVIAPIKVADLRDLISTVSSPLPSLQRESAQPSMQLF